MGKRGQDKGDVDGARKIKSEDRMRNEGEWESVFEGSMKGVV